jgi:hypothetical protein
LGPQEAWWWRWARDWGLLALDWVWVTDKTPGMRAMASSQRQSARAAQRWAKKLVGEVAEVVSRHPGADAEDVRLTLIALQSVPLERLNRSLCRGRGFAAFRK